MAHQTLAKLASIISRGSNRFFDQALFPYDIGCGQQFFLSQIAEHEGISMYDLAKLGRFDKATVTRAIQKLVEVGYITCVIDESDRRIHRLYTTQAAAQLLAYLRERSGAWERILTASLTQAEIDTVRALMEKVARNASAHQKEGETANG